jgi:hypothetical protein
VKQSALAIALLPLLFTPVINAETSTVAVMDNRAAQEISPRRVALADCLPIKRQLCANP